MEQKIITLFLITCLTLGFFCLVDIYLPAAQTPKTLAKQTPPLSEWLEGPEPISSKAIATPPRWQTPSGARVDFQPANSPPVEEAPSIEPEVVFAEGDFTLQPYHPLPAMAEREGLFNVPYELKAEVEFWRNVYANYTTAQSIVHDARSLGLVYGVIDFTPLMEEPTLTKEQKDRQRRQIEEKRRNEISLQIKGEAASRVRSQWGQKDRFVEGYLRAAPYLTHLEKIFVEEGVPPEMTRLAFVESMFQWKARSKVGAAGPYQFMPATAKRYSLMMNDWCDERNDPLIAGRAAARLLKRQYHELSTWPLSINAYNTGGLRMAKAVKRMQTRNIATIIRYFQDPGYQFASRNFYPEFLAALEVADHPKDYLGIVNTDPPLQFVAMTVVEAFSPLALADHMAMDVGVLRDLNPALAPRLFEAGHVVPTGYVLRLPGTDRSLYLSALRDMQEGVAQEGLQKPAAKSMVMQETDTRIP